jgi:hypothetical protein
MLFELPDKYGPWRSIHARLFGAWMGTMPPQTRTDLSDPSARSENEHGHQIKREGNR